MSRPDPQLVDAAFGARPGAGPLPAVTDPYELWLRAVVLGGQGRYAQARADLTELTRRTGGRGVWGSLAASTRASFLRQSGRHGEAARFDGAAVAALGNTVADTPTAEPVPAAAVPAEAALADALTGLAADALGGGRLALGWRLLGRCADLLTAYPEGDVIRQRVRLHWVSAELSLAGGDFDHATEHAGRSVALSGEWGSVRHQVKSTLLQCAAMTGTASPGQVLECAESVRSRCRELGLVPLEWAASLLIEGVSSGARGVVERQRCEELLRRRGGHFRR